MTNATYQLGSYAKSVDAALADLREQNAMGRFWMHDPTFWKKEPAHTKIIVNALGWLTVPSFVRAFAGDLATFADKIAEGGYTHVVLMGMGGSSLCPEVLRRTNVPMAGHPELVVLDSTVPATVRRIEKAIDPAKTLFVVSSKSGTTIEPSVFYAYFFDVVKKLKGDKAGENFITITDPGTLMTDDAKRDHFRHIYANPPDIGGRYSALSYFGMVPAALMGLDAGVFLDRALTAVHECGPHVPIEENPGARLGAALGALAREGRDKVTLVTPAPLEALGLWIEQLIAESTGKEGKGILPVAGEALGSPSVYGKDRVFVQIRTAQGSDGATDARLKELADAGHPVITHVLADTMDLGAEFFRWEIAIPLAGQRIGINPFDQPNVQESKDNTNELLAEYQKRGSLTEQEVVAEHGALRLYADVANKEELLAGGAGSLTGRDRVLACLKAHFARVKAGDYVAITQYFDEREIRDQQVETIRLAVRDRRKVATTTGYGPRFLHSTGQLHKGGPDTGVFLQLTADDGSDLAIPGKPYGFATLVKAQHLGDYASLAKRHRRALRCHLGENVDAGLKELMDLVHAAVS